jgi:hypothetical protein
MLRIELRDGRELNSLCCPKIFIAQT